MSLYGNLFRYREGRERKPLENFLSEALKDLLNRLPKNEATAFTLDVLLNERRRTKDAAATRSLNSLKVRLASSSSLHWDTQCPIRFAGQTKIPDISAFGSGCRLLAIEVKVGQQLADQQLEHYGGGLAGDNRVDPDLGCALVFLSHATGVPSDFLSSEAAAGSQYHVPLRGACSWTDVYEWLSDAHARANPGTFTAGLIGEFAEFLKENHMDAMNEADLDALREVLSCGTQGKLLPLLKRTREVIAPLVARGYYHGRGDIYDAFAESNGTKVWDWCYSDKQRGQWYIAWGLGLGGKDTHLGIDFPEGDSLLAFLVVTSEKRTNGLPVFRLLEALKTELGDKGWTFEESQMACVKTHEAVNFAHGPGGITEGFARWLEESFPEADQIMNACIGLGKAGQ